MRWLGRLLLILVLAGAAAFAWMHHEARLDPVVRRATVHLPDWPSGKAPLRVLLLGDIHMGSAAMDAARLERIVDQANALAPDLVLIAGDFVYGNDPAAGARAAQQLVAPLSRLRAPLGVVAVSGNHDYWAGSDSLPPALRRAGVTLLENGATVRGALAIGGLADGYTLHARIPATMTALYKLPGAKIVLTHAPDVTPYLPGKVHLVLAAHTHCGQMVVPWLGSLSRVARARYGCGWTRDRDRLNLVTAGIGTSILPLRLGADPDMWILTLRD
jgi:predicted MPP superfamily phosphohydrolase